MRKTALTMIAVMALMLAACSSEEGSGQTGGATGQTGGVTGGAVTAGTTGTPTATGTTGPTAPTGAEGDCPDLTGEGPVFTITVSGFAFHPDCFTASASQGISVVNEDSAPHTFTMPGTIVDAPVPAGETFNGEPIAGVVAPGVYDFLCTIHPSMTGTVTVVE